MRPYLVVALAFASVAPAVHADSFLLTGTKGDTISFTLAHSPTPTYTSSIASSGSRFALDPVSIVVNGVTTSNTITFYDPAAGGALTITDAGQGKLGDDGTGLLLESTGLALFSGSNANPTFLPGTYTLLDASAKYGVNPRFKENFTLMITGDTSAVAVTPEPSGLALLGTGLLSVTALARRRFVA